MLDERNGSLLCMKMKAEAVDSGKGDLIVGDAIEAEISAFAEGGTAEMAAFKLAFCSFRWKPRFLAGFGRRLGWG